MILSLIQLDNPAEILLVEDRTSDVELMREALEECDVYHRLHVVRNGEEALAFLHQQGKYQSAPRPNLILLDLNLPRLNGHEVLAVIKTDPTLKFLPVVILTTSTTPRDIYQSYALQANCCIIKPTDLDEFIELIKLTIQFWLSSVTLPLTSDKF